VRPSIAGFETLSEPGLATPERRAAAAADRPSGGDAD